MTVPAFTKSGTKTTDIDVDKSVFGVKEINHQLIKQSYAAYLANGRVNRAVTKTRGLVRGGGKKPWRQKGTGRARFGSSRNPIWRGGGVVFGPTGEENYVKKQNLKAKRQALRQALSSKVLAKAVVAIDSFDKIQGKTAELKSLLGKLGSERRTLLVISELSEGLSRASANLTNISLIKAQDLNIKAVIDADKLVFDKAALEFIKQWLGGSK